MDKSIRIIIEVFFPSVLLACSRRCSRLAQQDKAEYEGEG